MDRLLSFSLAIALIAILPSLLHENKNDDLNNPDSNFARPRSPVEVPGMKIQGFEEGRFIVRFHRYKPYWEHKAALEDRLRDDSPFWAWMDRHNPALVYPTDFGIVSIRRDEDRLIDKIRSFDFVKDVFPEARYTRSPLSEMNADAQEAHSEEVLKKPGKMFTGMSYDDGLNVSEINLGRKLFLQRSQITSMFGAEKLWAKGYTGATIKMAIFDTGIRADHAHFRNIKGRTNWTNESTLNDNLGHGTFVAGVIASQDKQCPGFAPDADIYAFRVFTDAQVSYTSWFLDAFNYAIATGMNVLNLSIGGPDYLDRPFVEKVWELTANKIIMVSAIGNDGPLYGTLNNPADQSDVIGVGGIDYNDNIASFSSRGMTTWELPHGYGRVKPDVVAYGRDIVGSKISTGCRTLSGTSVASPVVAGIVCLLASVIPESNRWDILNPASLKQALVEGAAKLGGPNMFEQGAGRIDLLESYEILIKYKPRASIFPNSLDFTDCPYSWPFCRQPLYAGAMPVIFNATILNGMGVVGYVQSEPKWQPSNDIGNLLSIQFTYSSRIWPWTGYLALHMQIKDEGSQFSGIIEGNVSLTIESAPGKGQMEPQRSVCVLHLRVQVIPTPPRSQRILWDQFHNIRYPPGYIPRDSLDVRNDILDWHGDHPHTNFHGMFDMLRDAGYFVEILGSPLTCFDAKKYGTLLLVDLEDEFFSEEIDKLEVDVKVNGLGLIVFADWYNVETMIKMKFFDDNTRSWWTPATGGANIPALNDLLKPFGIAFGDTILNGPFSIGGERCHYASGTDIAVFPKDGFVHRFSFEDNTYAKTAHSLMQATGLAKEEAAILGVLELHGANGRIAAYGDSNCLDSSHIVVNCYWLLKKLLDFTSKNIKDPLIFAPSRRLETSLVRSQEQLPSRREDVNFSSYSAVLKGELLCKNDARFEVWGAHGYRTNPWNTRRLPGVETRFTEEDSTWTNISISGRTYAEQDVVINLPKSIAANIDKNISKYEAYRGDTSQDSFVHINIETNTSNKRHSPKLDFLGWLNREEPEEPAFVIVQWLVPAVLFITGLLLGLSFWRVRQRRRRRGRKGILRSSNFVV